MQHIKKGEMKKNGVYNRANGNQMISNDLCIVHNGTIWSIYGSFFLTGQLKYTIYDSQKDH